MKHLLLAAASILMAETAALSCSCGAPEDPAELQAYAESLGEDAAALVEAETLTSFEATRTGERMRLVRTLAGTAPGEFKIQRHSLASGSMCDVLYRVGERAIIILFPTGVTDGGLQVYRTSGVCTAPLVENPAFRDALIRALNDWGERG